ncbi:MAG: hypothetical protein AseanaTS_29610 [Candidatus Pelagadaptatus aseana]|uniref:DUF1631 family protein n=1 Tax=Candidatus Pelagadaptatus aseana TaxID=3120508 RepID=UPI0039B27FA0
MNNPATAQESGVSSSAAKMRHGVRLRRIVQGAFSGVDDALFEKADGAATNKEQNDWFEIMRHLRVSRQVVEQQLLVAMDQEIDRLALQGLDFDQASISFLTGAYHRALGRLATTPVVGEMLIQEFRRRLEASGPVAGADTVTGAGAEPEFGRSDLTDAAAEDFHFRAWLQGQLMQGDCSLPRLGQFNDWLQERLPEGIDIPEEEDNTCRVVVGLSLLMVEGSPRPELAERCLCRLLPAVLAMALDDGDFLNSREHPARFLLNEVVAGCATADDPEVFASEVMSLAEVIEAGLGDSSESAAAIFQVALENVRQCAQPVGQNLQQQRLCQVEGDRARADLARDYVQQQIDLMSEAAMAGEVLPDVVQQLLEGPWLNAMLLTYLQQGEASEAWQEQRQVVRDLAWSVSGNYQSVSELLGTLPGLLQRLRAGIESVPHDLFKVNELFRQLEQVHLAAMQPGSVRAEAEVVAVARGVPVAEPVDQWLEQVEQLRPGCCFDVSADDGELRYRLAAFIRDADRLVFVDRDGAKVAEMSRRAVADAIRDERFRLVASDDLFDQALQAVISDLRKA